MKHGCGRRRVTPPATAEWEERTYPHLVVLEANGQQLLWTEEGDAVVDYKRVPATKP